MLEDRIESLATGDTWLGYDALDMGLVDRIVTSDEYIGERLDDGARVLKLVPYQKSQFPWGRPRVGSTVTTSMLSLQQWLIDIFTRFIQSIFMSFQQVFALPM